MNIHKMYSKETIDKVRSLAEQGFNDREIADMVNLGMKYFHVGYIRKVNNILAGVHIARRKMEPEEWEQICTLRRAGARWDDLGMKFCRHPTTLSQRFRKENPKYPATDHDAPKHLTIRTQAQVATDEIKSLASRGFKWQQIAAMTRQPYRRVRETLGMKA